MESDSVRKVESPRKQRCWPRYRSPCHWCLVGAAVAVNHKADFILVVTHVLVVHLPADEVCAPRPDGTGLKPMDDEEPTLPAECIFANSWASQATILKQLTSPPFKAERGLFLLVLLGVFCHGGIWARCVGATFYSLGHTSVPISWSTPLFGGASRVYGRGFKLVVFFRLYLASGGPSGTVIAYDSTGTVAGFCQVYCAHGETFLKRGDFVDVMRIELLPGPHVLELEVTDVGNAARPKLTYETNVGVTPVRSVGHQRPLCGSSCGPRFRAPVPPHPLRKGHPALD